MKFSLVSECKPGKRIKGVYLCSQKQIRLTRSGNRYIQITVKDRSGSIPGKIWNNPGKFDTLFKMGDIVGITAVVDSFQEMIQLRVMRIRSINNDELSHHGISLSNLIPTSKKSGSYLFTQVITMAGMISSAPLKQLVIEILYDNEEALINHPGSSKLHHNYRGGLLEHVVSMLKVGRIVTKLYDLDEDMLVSGIILHDIGKLNEISNDLSYEYSTEGKMIGHLILSRDQVRKMAEKISGLDKNDLLKLEHMILSHHGDYEWQSPRKPCFPEALMLHLIDRMDAQMNLINTTIGLDVNPGNWTAQKNYFRMSLYKGKYETE